MKTTDRNKVLARIRAAQKKRGLTGQACAEAMGWASRNSWSAIAGGHKTDASAETLARMGKVVGLAIEHDVRETWTVTAE